MTDAEKLADAILWEAGIRFAELTPYGRARVIAAAQAGIDETLERAAKVAEGGLVLLDIGGSQRPKDSTSDAIAATIRAMKEQTDD